MRLVPDIRWRQTPKDAYQGADHGAAQQKGDEAEEAGEIWGGDHEDCGREVKRRLEHE